MKTWANLPKAAKAGRSSRGSSGSSRRTNHLAFYDPGQAPRMAGCSASFCGAPPRSRTLRDLLPQAFFGLVPFYRLTHLGRGSFYANGTNGTRNRGVKGGRRVSHFPIPNAKETQKYEEIQY